jgi:hypothetical protein
MGGGSMRNRPLPQIPRGPRTRGPKLEIESVLLRIQSTSAGAGKFGKGSIGVKGAEGAQGGSKERGSGAKTWRGRGGRVRRYSGKVSVQAQTYLYRRGEGELQI